MYLKQIILDFQCPECKSGVTTTEEIDSKVDRDGEPVIVATKCPVCEYDVLLSIHYHKEND